MRSLGTEIPNRIVKGFKVINGDIGLDVMDRIEDKPTVFAKDLHIFLDLSPNFLWGAKGKHFLRIDPSCPEGEPIPKAVFKLLWVHSGG